MRHNNFINHYVSCSLHPVQQIILLVVYDAFESLINFDTDHSYKLDNILLGLGNLNNFKSVICCKC